MAEMREITGRESLLDDHHIEFDDFRWREFVFQSEKIKNMCALYLHVFKRNIWSKNLFLRKICNHFAIDHIFTEEVRTG